MEISKPKGSIIPPVCVSEIVDIDSLCDHTCDVLVDAVAAEMKSTAQDLEVHQLASSLEDLSEGVSDGCNALADRDRRFDGLWPSAAAFVRNYNSRRKAFEEKRSCMSAAVRDICEYSSAKHDLLEVINRVSAKCRYFAGHFESVDKEVSTAETLVEKLDRRMLAAFSLAFPASNEQMKRRLPTRRRRRHRSVQPQVHVLDWTSYQEILLPGDASTRNHVDAIWETQEKKQAAAVENRFNAFRKALLDQVSDVQVEIKRWREQREAEARKAEQARRDRAAAEQRQAAERAETAKRAELAAKKAAEEAEAARQKQLAAGPVEPVPAATTVANEMAANSNDVAEDLRQSITRFFAAHKPKKLGDVDKLCAKYSGHETKLLEMFSQKYGKEFTDFLTPALRDHYRVNEEPSRKEGEAVQVFDNLTPRVESISEPASGAEALSQRIADLLKTHNPSKLNELPSLLQKYAGNEEALLKKIEDKYVKSQSPKAMAASQAAASVATTQPTTPRGSSLFGSKESTPSQSTTPFPAASSSLFQKSPSLIPGAPSFGSSTGQMSSNSLFAKQPQPQPQLSGMGFSAKPSATAHLSPQEVELRLRNIYMKYEPSKLASIPNLLQKYKGNEAELLARAEQKYLNKPIVPDQQPQLQQHQPATSLFSGSASNAGFGQSSPFSQAGNPTFGGASTFGQSTQGSLFSGAAAPTFGQTPALKTSLFGKK